MCIILVLATSSCQKWLDVKPENEQVSDLYWSNKEEVEAVLGAAYVKLRGTVETMLVWGEARGNTLQIGAYSTGDLIRLKGFSVIPTNEWTKWADFYAVINYANMVLRYAPDVMEKDPSFNRAVMESFRSEAYFLRALSYFYLVRTFGDIPLILDPYQNDDQAYELAKSPKEEVFTQIISDLTTALDASKDTWPTIWETKGRSTRWSIHALLADVYLWTGDYDAAIISCNAVLDSGRYGLLEGMVNGDNNWFTIFGEGNTNEGIFEIQFDYTKEQTNSLVSMFGTNNKWVISPYLLLLYEENSEDIRGVDATYLEGSLQLWKYLGAEGNTTIPRPYSDQNWILYRMADIYLMKAEALIMKGQASYGEAISLINDVRLRAGVTRPLDVETTEIALLNALLQERSREFAGEGKSWFDLLRVAQRNDYAYKEYFIEQVLLGAGGASTPVIQSTLRNVNSHYLPINQDEIDNNKLLLQNPYYETLN